MPSRSRCCWSVWGALLADVTSWGRPLGACRFPFRHRLFSFSRHSWLYFFFQVPKQPVDTHHRFKNKKKKDQLTDCQMSCWYSFDQLIGFDEIGLKMIEIIKAIFKNTIEMELITVLFRSADFICIFISTCLRATVLVEFGISTAGAAAVARAVLNNPWRSTSRLSNTRALEQWVKIAWKPREEKRLAHRVSSTSSRACFVGRRKQGVNKSYCGE